MTTTSSDKLAAPGRDQADPAEMVAHGSRHVDVNAEHSQIRNSSGEDRRQRYGTGVRHRQKNAGFTLTASPALGIAALPYIACMRRDAALYGFVAVYALFGLLIGIAAGVPHKFVPFAYISVIRVVLALVLGIGVWALVSREPFAAVRRLFKAVSSPANVAAVLLFAALSVHMGVFTSVKTMLTDIVPFYADPFLADLDEFLHGQPPWEYTTTLLPPDLTRTLERFYFGMWGVLVPGSLLAALFLRRLQKARAQYVWTLVLIWPLLGNFMAGAMMSAGPVYDKLVVGEPRFAGLVEYLAQNSAGREWAAVLWQSYLSGAAGAGSGISAFPSLHLAMATMYVLLASRLCRWLMWTAVAFCALVLFGSVHLGWHYAVDGYFSIAATVLIWKVVGWVLKARSNTSAAHATLVHGRAGS